MQAKQAMKFPERLRIYVTGRDLETNDNFKALSLATIRAVERESRADGFWKLDNFPILADISMEQDTGLMPLVIRWDGMKFYPKRRMIKLTVFGHELARYRLPAAANTLFRPTSLRLSLVGKEPVTMEWTAS